MYFRPIINGRYIKKRLDEINNQLRRANRTTLLAVCFTGIFTLCGVFLGWWLQNITENRNKRLETYLSLSNLKTEFLDLYEEYLNSVIEYNYYKAICLNSALTETYTYQSNSPNFIVESQLETEKNIKLRREHCNKQEILKERIEEKRHFLSDVIARIAWYWDKDSDLPMLLSKISVMKPEWIGFPKIDNSKIRNNRDLIRWKEKANEQLEKYLENYYRKPFNTLLHHLTPDR